MRLAGTDRPEVYISTYRVSRIFEGIDANLILWNDSSKRRRVSPLWKVNVYNGSTKRSVGTEAMREEPG